MKPTVKLLYGQIDSNVAMKQFSNLEYYLSFSHCLGIGPVKFDALVKQFGDVKNAYEGSKKELEDVIGIKIAKDFIDFRSRFDPAKKLEEMQKKGITLLTRSDKRYPQALLTIPDPPIALYVRGDLSLVDLNKELFFSIVGTRKPSAYGAQITRKFSQELASCGFIVVSGMAIGIDTIAHLGALDNGGKTVAVLGCGVDIIYPPTNKNLYERIIKGGGIVISEFPPGMTTLPGLFVARNRIVSGLSIGTLVAEGLEGSGSLITARYAAEQGKHVFAPPSPITSPTSFVPNLLLKEGARLVTSTQDILDECNLKVTPSRKKQIEIELTEEEKKIVRVISNEPQLPDEIVGKTKLTSPEVSQFLSLLEIKGVVEKNSEGKYQLIN